MSRPSSQPIRWIELVRALWGLILLFAPREMLHSEGSSQADERAVVTFRVLGARHLIQAALSGLRPTRDRLAVGAAVDFIHAGTGLAFGTADERRRRVAFTDAAVALIWSGWSWRD